MRLKYFSNPSLTIQQRFTISKPLASRYPLNCRPTRSRPHLWNLLVRAYISSPDKTWSFPTKLSAGVPWLHTSSSSQLGFTVEVDRHISRLRNDCTSWSFVDPVPARRLCLIIILQQNITGLRVYQIPISRRSTLPAVISRILRHQQKRVH